jgi:hypothetical protein
VLAQIGMKFPNVFRAVLALFRFFRRPEFVSEEEFQTRQLVCGGCPHYDRVYGQCEECSCFISVKARLGSEKCPLGKW